MKVPHQPQAETPAPHGITADVPAPSAGADQPPVASPKPRRAPLSPEQLARICTRLDAVLLALVGAFAFLTASFAARNSDLFQYLATGRLITEGKYEFGKDPFTYTSEGVRWVDHSWLYSAALYNIYRSSEHGGTVLVVLKALLVAGLAAVLLYLAHVPGRRWWLPASCVALAVLALSPRLLLQPVVVSYLFLALTLLLLRWPRLRPAVSFRSFWLLPPLFALWVNLDQWFFLGPVLAGLYLLGLYLQQALPFAEVETDVPARGEVRALGVALAVGVAACLLNPHHVFAFTLPAQLGFTEGASAIQKDRLLQTLYLSPLDKLYWQGTTGVSVAGLAYFPLLGLGLASFTLSLKTPRWQRLLPWAAFALLSLYHARAIPFFAVLAGPVMAWNFLDYAAECFGTELRTGPAWRRWALGGRALGLAAAAALVVCTIPGWVQSQPYENRRVAWKVVPDESLVKTARTIASWREEGLIEDDARWFNTSPDVLYYLAWYCPGERAFFDLRLALFDRVAADFVDARHDLTRPPPRPGSDEVTPPGPPAWQRVFAKHHVRYVVLYFSSIFLADLDETLKRLFSNPDEWTPLFLDAHTVVCGWTDPADKQADRHQFDRLRWDATPLAFGPNPVRAPQERPARAPARHEWYTTFWEPPPPHRVEVERAVMYSIFDEAQQQRWQETYNERFRRWSLITKRAGAFAGMPVELVLRDTRQPYINDFFADLHPLPPAALYLALRSLRQSLHENPDDPFAYFALGIIYAKLYWQTSENMLSTQTGYLQFSVLRQTQIVTSLNQALQLNPEFELAHQQLADLYFKCRMLGIPNYVDNTFSTTFYDVELRHRKEQLRLAGLKGTPPQGVVEETDRLQDLVKKLLDQYEIKSANLPPLRRAETALRYGLVDEALAVLQRADPKDLFVGRDQSQFPLGALLQVKLLVSLGRVDEVRKLFQEEEGLKVLNRVGELDLPAYDWFNLLVAAGSGDYAEADKLLETLSVRLGKDRGDAVAALAANALAERASRAGPAFPMERLFRAAAGRGLVPFAVNLLQREADATTLRGLLALEAGRNDDARRHLRATLALALPRDGSLAAGAAVGAALPPGHARLRDGAMPAAGSLPLRSRPLAATALYWLDGR